MGQIVVSANGKRQTKKWRKEIAPHIFLSKPKQSTLAH
jgi:hypothetical protein